MQTIDMKNKINSNLTHDTNTENKPDNTNNKQVFVLERKTNIKDSKKAFNTVMEESLVNELDKIAKKSGYSRNELISKMCQFCVENIEIK